MKKDELECEIKNSIIAPKIIAIMILFLYLTLISSPFVWIWYSGSLSFKIALSSVIGIIILYYIDKIIEKAIKKGASKYKELNP